MNHDPDMHAMMVSMWFLMAMPFAFVLIAVLWYRLSAEGRARRFDEEAPGPDSTPY